MTRHAVPDARDLYRARVLEHRTLLQIGDRHHVGASTVRTWLARAGIRVPPRPKHAVSFGTQEALAAPLQTYSQVRDRMVPDITVPEQFARMPSRAERSPEHRLLLAVLENAIDTLRLRVVNAHRTAAVAEARAWIASDAVGVTSFVGICHAFDFDVGWLRARLLGTDGRVAVGA